MISLNCPSCGSQLELPNSLDIAHCMYCGTKILLRDSDANRERVNLKRYKELSKAAMDAKNYEETIRYTNKILEINLNDVDAWIEKAVATFWLSTRENNRYSEAIIYLKKAEEINPDETRIRQAMEDVTKLQSVLLNKLGIDADAKGKEIYKIWDKSDLKNMDRARRESAKSFYEAMDYFITASDYCPTDMAILENIERLAKTTGWLMWENNVREKRNSLRMLKKKSHAVKKIAQLQKELETNESKLTRLKTQTGLLVGSKIIITDSKNRGIKLEIAELEEYANYNPPDVVLPK